MFNVKHYCDYGVCIKKLTRIFDRKLLQPTRLFRDIQRRNGAAENAKMLGSVCGSVRFFGFWKMGVMVNPCGDAHFLNVRCREY